MRKIVLGLFTLVLFAMTACQEQVEHTAPAILPSDSAAMMSSYGVNTLISDSGVIKYRIVTEEWIVNTNLHPSRWIFNKGLFLEQFDEKFHVNSYIQADSAMYYDQDKLWHLRGRVKILTKDGLRFASEELYWDEMKHEIYSYTFSRLVTPERTLQGTYFRSDERMTNYTVSNSRGSFERGDMENSGTDSVRSAPDTVKERIRPQALPQRKNESIPLTR